MGGPKTFSVTQDMEPNENPKFALSERPSLSRGFVALMLLEIAVLLILALNQSSNEQLRWTNFGAGAAIFAAAYFAAFKNTISDKILGEILSPLQVLIASLVVASLANSITIHYALILSLSLSTLFRNRRALAFATVTAVVDQSLRSVFLPESVFAIDIAARAAVVIEHITWLGVAGGILLVFCEPPETAESPAKAAAEAAVLDLSKSAAPPLVGADNSSELIRVATEVGARTHKLHKSISNIEGPLRRMHQSINGANKGMLEIKDELSRTAANVIQVTQSSEMHAEKAKSVFQAAEEAAYGSQIGALSTEQTIRNMDNIRVQMDSIAQRMDNLLSKSQLMVQVVGFADELALQSKVLSVNAAIEAAKAGDRGEGFSAVAREVKSLANQSKEATRQVRQILKEIQKSIAEVRRSIALGNETVDVASDQCRGTVESIKGLDSSVGTSRDAAEAIMNSSKDQVQGMMQIAHAMNDIQSVSDQNAGSIGNLQVEAQKLNNIARDLLMEMNAYKSLVDDLLTQCASITNNQEASSP